MDILPSLWPLAFGHLKVKTQAGPNEHWEQVRWQVLSGKRLKAGGQFASSPMSQTILLIAAIVSESLRFLTRWFLSRRSHASRSKPKHWQASPLMDFANPLVSPVFRVLQYFAACLQGAAPRLKLLWGRQGFRSFSHWAGSAANAEALAMLRRAITCAASRAHSRFVVEGMCWPWRLDYIADERLSYACRLEVAREFRLGPLDKLDYYFGRRLYARVHSPAAMFDDDVQGAIKHWAWGVRMGISDTEQEPPEEPCRHGLDKLCWGACQCRSSTSA
jgi:hypothetical protein